MCRGGDRSRRTWCPRQRLKVMDSCIYMSGRQRHHHERRSNNIIWPLCFESVIPTHFHGSKARLSQNPWIRSVRYGDLDMSLCDQDMVNTRNMNILDYKVAGKFWPFGPPSKLGLGHFWAHFSVKVGRTGGFGCPISKHGFLGMGPFVCGAVLSLWRVPCSVKFVLITCFALCL